MRFSLVFLSALVLGAASRTAVQAAVSRAPLITAIDVMVAPAADSPVALRTYANARCVLSAPGTSQTLTVYANDEGSVPLHVTPKQGGAVSAVLTARCDSRGQATTSYIRLHVDRRAPRPLAARPAFGALPLLPFGVNPTTLTQADTKRLELPPRPDAIRDPRDYAEWLRAVTTPVRRIGGTTMLRRDIAHAPGRSAGHLRRLDMTNLDFQQEIASGIVDTGFDGEFAYWVAGKWTVPSVFTLGADSPAYMAILDGLDEYNEQGNNRGDLIEDGTEQDAFYLPTFGSVSFYTAWYDYWPDAGENTIPNFGVNPGDDIYAVSWVCYDGYGRRYGCFFLENDTQGEATPVYSELGQYQSWFQGNSAEWLAVRPAGVHPLPYFTPFTYSWEHVYDSYLGAGENACNESETVLTMIDIISHDTMATASPSGCDSTVFNWTGFQ